MSLNVVVCVKQIPDPADPGSLNDDFTLNRSGKLILDESDSYGVEMALQMVDNAGGGEVTLVSMAPNGETGGLRTALAMGAEKAVLVTDPELAGAGSLDTARTLAAAMGKAGDYDLIIAGVESSDGYTGVVPQMLAGELGIPMVSFAKEVSVADGKLSVKRQTETGSQDVESTTPAVVSVTAGVVEPRYPSFKGIMAAKKKPVDEVSVSDLGIETATVGWSGAGQEIVAVEDAPAREAGEIVEDEGEGFAKIVAKLEELKVI